MILKNKMQGTDTGNGGGGAGLTGERIVSAQDAGVKQAGLRSLEKTQAWGPERNRPL